MNSLWSSGWPQTLGNHPALASCVLPGYDLSLGESEGYIHVLCHWDSVRFRGVLAYHAEPPASTSTPLKKREKYYAIFNRDLGIRTFLVPVQGFWNQFWQTQRTHYPAKSKKDTKMKRQRTAHRQTWPAMHHSLPLYRAPEVSVSYTVK